MIISHQPDLLIDRHRPNLESLGTGKAVNLFLPLLPVYLGVLSRIHFLTVHNFQFYLDLLVTNLTDLRIAPLNT